uniref:GRB2 n=1 Tax=Macrostomum lignano TaxID=282301 RepID=A0A1I8GDK8_9PLAT
CSNQSQLLNVSNYVALFASSKGMEAVALHDFNPGNPDELPFTRNQVLKILSMEEDPGWYLAEANGVTGLIPNNYVRMQEHSWYVPNCSRTKAEEILLRRDARGGYVQPDGAFLVRTSETTAPDFSLSVKYGGQHHRTHSVSQTNQTMLLRDMVTDSSGPSPAPAPGPAPIPQQVIALFDFNPQDPDELRFRQNDIITVLGREDDSWWLGQTQDGRRGVFPYNYVQKYS